MESLKLISGIGAAVLDPHLGHVRQIVVPGCHILPDVTAQIGITGPDEKGRQKDQGRNTAVVGESSLFHDSIGTST